MAFFKSIGTIKKNAHLIQSAEDFYANVSLSCCIILYFIHIKYAKDVAASEQK